MTIHSVLDTNVLLSALAFPASLPGAIVATQRAGSLQVSLSHYILDELRRVLPKLRSRHDLSDDGTADLMDCSAFQADLVEPAARWDAQLTDPFDRAILSKLMAAQTTSSPATRPCSLWLVNIRRSEQPGFSRCMGLLQQTAGDISGGSGGMMP